MPIIARQPSMTSPPGTTLRAHLIHTATDRHNPTHVLDTVVGDGRLGLTSAGPTRQELDTMLTRGQHENHVYTATLA